MTEPTLEPIPLKLSYRSYLWCFFFTWFGAMNLIVFFAFPPLWLRLYASLMVLFVGYMVLEFLRCGRKWTRTDEELIVPTLLNPKRRHVIPEWGIAFQKLGPVILIVYLGDPEDRETPRMTSNLCMSPTDILNWFP